MADRMPRARPWRGVRETNLAWIRLQGGAGCLHPRPFRVPQGGDVVARPVPEDTVSGRGLRRIEHLVHLVEPPPCVEDVPGGEIGRDGASEGLPLMAQRLLDRL